MIVKHNHPTSVRPLTSSSSPPSFFVPPLFLTHLPHRLFSTILFPFFPFLFPLLHRQSSIGSHPFTIVGLHLPSPFAPPHCLHDSSNPRAIVVPQNPHFLLSIFESPLPFLPPNTTTLSRHQWRLVREHHHCPTQIATIDTDRRRAPPSSTTANHHNNQITRNQKWFALGTKEPISLYRLPLIAVEANFQHLRSSI